MTITETRRRLAAALEGIDGDIKVHLAPSEYDRGATMGSNGGDELNYIVKVFLGSPSDTMDEKLDELLEADGEKSVRKILGSIREGMRCVVTRTSGHRLYQNTPTEAPRIGAEWTVKVLL